MRVVGVLVCLIFLSGCGEEVPIEDSRFPNTTVGFDNIGNSNVLLDCTDASRQISSDLSGFGIQPQVELGMSAAEIRSIVGKPRHIYLGVWTFGFDQPVNVPVNPLWDLMPTVTVTTFSEIGTTAFSGDNTVCDGTEFQFIADANTIVNSPDTESHRNEVPACRLAARRIAANVELGMTADQVRDLVGKPVEITVEGLWRYKYGPLQILDDSPVVQFGDPSLIGTTDESGNSSSGDTEETGINSVRVIGYWSPENVCPL